MPFCSAHKLAEAEPGRSFLRPRASQTSAAAWDVPLSPEAWDRSSLGHETGDQRPITFFDTASPLARSCSHEGPHPGRRLRHAPAAADAVGAQAACGLCQQGAPCGRAPAQPLRRVRAARALADASAAAPARSADDCAPNRGAARRGRHRGCAGHQLPAAGDVLLHRGVPAQAGREDHHQPGAWRCPRAPTPRFGCPRVCARRAPRRRGCSGWLRHAAPGGCTAPPVARPGALRRPPR